MEQLIASNYITATDLTETIIRKTGLSFRQANFLVGSIVREMIASKIPLSEICPGIVKKAGMSVLGKEIVLSEKDLRDATDPHKVVENKKNIGHPSPAETGRMIASRKKMIDGAARRLQGMAKKLEVSEKNFRKTIKEKIK